MLPTRPNVIDYGKAFMIYCVILGHYTYALGLPYTPSPVWSLMHAITLFHMPFFFIVSGMLFKQLDVKTVIQKGWIQLIRPYLIMCFVCTLILLLVNVYEDKNGLIKYVAKLILGILSGYDLKYATSSWSGSLWFCFSLFIIKIYFSIIHESLKSIMGGVLLFTSVVAICIMYAGNVLPFRIDSSLVGFVFFYLGYACSNLIKKVQHYSISNKCWIFIMSVTLLSLSAYYNLTTQGLSINALRFGPYPPLFVISGVCGTIIVLLISTFISKYRSPVILRISNGTIVILGFHWTVYKLVFGWWLSSYNVCVSIIAAFINLLICYILILFCEKYCPAILGNRKLNL